MKKLIVILLIGFSFSFLGVAKQCVKIEASKEIAGGIYDWCNHVTCRKCVDADGPGATIYTTECWANC